MTDFSSVEGLLRKVKRELDGMKERRTELLKTVESCEHILKVLPAETTMPLPLNFHPVEEKKVKGINQRQFVFDKLKAANSQGTTNMELRRMYREEVGKPPSANFPYSPLGTMRAKGTVVERDGKFYLTDRA